MTQIEKLLFPLGLIFVGRLASAWRPEIARRAARVLMLIWIVGLAILALSGFMRSDTDNAAEIHKWSGHSLLAAAWLVVPYVVGAVSQRLGQSNPSQVVGVVTVLSVLFGLTLLESFAGYLGPSHIANDGNAVTDETKLRFQVLHLFVLPITIGLLLAVVVWLLRPANHAMKMKSVAGSSAIEAHKALPNNAKSG